MIRLAFFLPLFSIESNKDYLKLWIDFIRESCIPFGVKEYYVFGASERVYWYIKSQRPKGITIESLDEIEGEPVVITRSAEQILDSYVHPQNPTYIIGPDDWKIPWDEEFPGADKVRIETTTKYPLWSGAVAAIVLRDRIMKMPRIAGD